MTIAVELTWEDTLRGVRDDCTECPVVIATERAAKVAGVKASVIAGREINFLCPDGRWCGVDTPAEVADYIAIFDAEGPDAVAHLVPLAFTLDIPFAL